MGDLFHHLRRQVDANARRAVATYRRELDDFRRMEATGTALTTMFDFAVVLRRRTAELAENDHPFADDDLHFIASVGQERGERGISPETERAVRSLHTTLTLQEVREAAGPDEIADVLHILRWIGVNGVHAQNAYTRGFLAGQRNIVSFPRRVQRLAAMLLSDDPAAGQLAAGLAVAAGARTWVTVVRIHDDVGPFTDKVRTAAVEALLNTHRFPMMWRTPDEFVVLTPATVAATPFVPVDGDAVSVLRDLHEMVDRPCAAGSTVGRSGHLREATALARRISRVAPVQRTPRQVHTVADVIVELALGELPEVDRWLRALGELLDGGPDLIRTLDAFYRHDMNRTEAASALRIHPRTLDYRLHRAGDLTGLHPTSTRGVQVIGAAVTHAMRLATRPESPPA
ncbi:PucR family transcriptional regulator [Plantactinospora sp. WMMB334]|uniref:PucR family transcriptional regulator n=1 Tax=Plantactinospora sp. WMMB334 TaxID=3404119 RepID=UPI003B92C0F7